MKLFEKFDRYLVDNEIKVIISKNGVHIINYLEIIDFSSKEVVIKYKGGFIVLYGSDLVVSKMLDDELFIMGKLKSIVYN